MAAQNVKAKLHAVKPAQWSVLAASAFTFLAVCFSIGGVAGVWWCGSYQASASGSTLEVEFVSTLWESSQDSTFQGVSQTTTHSIDEGCELDGLDDTAQSNCNKYGAVRAMVFLQLLASVPAFGFAFAWLVLQLRPKDNAAKQLLKKFLLAGAICSLVASLCALLSVIIASTLDFSRYGDEVGVGGDGFVLAILSMVLCFCPSIALEYLAWRWSKELPAEDIVHPNPIGDMPSGNTKDSNVNGETV